MKLGIQGLKAEVLGIALANGPTVDRLILSSGKAQGQSKPFRLDMDSPAEVTAILSQESLQAYLEHKRPGGLRDFQVWVADDRLYVKAKLKLVVELPVKAACRLEIVDGREIHVRLEAVDVAGGSAKNLVAGQLEKENPILDTAEFPMNLTLTRIEAVDGEIRVHGLALPEAAPEG
ncbi:MAG: DUF2993 domain-containing protein [Fimbriimonadaceae bacterium]|nr:DUF2993 domain-containing protein [Fimbriimonadaceae bacterium]